jgi:DNA-binding XRE family transcriptional regulator
MSQQQLANEADRPKITIQRIENGKYSPTLDVVISIARGLKVPLKELMDYHLPKEKE